MADEKRPITVWHVDDDEDIRLEVAQVLENGGYTVLTTESFEEAKSMIPDGIKNVKVAILDKNLGDGTGGQIAKLLREKEMEEKEIPIGIIGLSRGKTSWADISLYKLDDFDDEQIAELLIAVAKLAERK